jgi:hypothetical protein
MIDVFGSGSFVAFLTSSINTLIPEDAIYSFNRQYGIHRHDDGNTTFQLVAQLPFGVMRHELLGLSYNEGSTVLALVTLRGVFRCETAPGADYVKENEWSADGEKLD